MALVKAVPSVGQEMILTSCGVSPLRLKVNVVVLPLVERLPVTVKPVILVSSLAKAMELNSPVSMVRRPMTISTLPTRRGATCTRVPFRRRRFGFSIGPETTPAR